MKISEPFLDAGWFFRVADRHFELHCTCGVEQRADALLTRNTGAATLYTCSHCSAPVIAVATDDYVQVAGIPRPPPSAEDGHRMCGFVFGATVDMTLTAPGTGEGALDIPARAGFVRRIAPAQ